MSGAQNTEALLKRLQGSESLTFRDRLNLVLRLSFPAILAQISSIIMQYIDASMVGQLGASSSASIGLVSSSTWLFGGICVAAGTGFTVQAAHKIGAGDTHAARGIMKQGLIVALGFSLLLLVLGASISGRLPIWLGGETAIQRDASHYFLVYILSLPLLQMNALAGGMLQSSGNMRVPSMLNIGMCILDVVFNSLLIFPARTLTVFGADITLPGAGLGVAGAALGTALAEACVAFFMLGILLFRSPALRLRKGEPLVFCPAQLKRALQIAVPIGFEQIVMCGAMVASTRIVSPLGTVAIAANSFAVTAESFCYMPGYGIGAAATTLVGQSIGAGNPVLARRLAWLTTGLGILVMTGTGCLMYWAAPAMIGVLTPDAAIRELGTAVLRIEVFAEPLYAASIVASGALRGAGDTLVPSCMNFASMWLVRLPLALLLAPTLGLKGVWIAMCLELCVRGCLFLLRLKGNRWLPKKSLNNQ